MNMIRIPQNRVSDEQAQRILEMIQNGDLKVGDKLPGQRELSVMLNISRSSIREAIRHLEALGILETRTGLGTYVISDFPKTDSSLSEWLREHQDEVFKIFEVREALESKAAELAALKVEESQIHEMSLVVQKMIEAARTKSLEQLVQADVDFHYLLVRISGNELLDQIGHYIQNALKDSRHAVLALPGRGIRSAREHQAILDAISTHDPEEAKKAMIVHLKNAVGETILDNPRR